MTSCNYTRSRPKFRGCQCWAVNDELLCGLVICGCGLDASNERSVTDFGLDIRAEDHVVFHERLPIGLLLRAAPQVERDREHAEVKAERLFLATQNSP